MLGSALPPTVPHPPPISKRRRGEGELRVPPSSGQEFTKSSRNWSAVRANESPAGGVEGEKGKQKDSNDQPPSNKPQAEPQSTPDVIIIERQLPVVPSSGQTVNPATRLHGSVPAIGQVVFNPILRSCSQPCGSAWKTSDPYINCQIDQ